MPLFVWVQGLRGPEPQVILLEQVSGEGKDKLDVLQKHRISAGLAALPIAELIETFPFGGVADA